MTRVVADQPLDERLGQLLNVEQRLQRQVEAARLEAERLVADARALAVQGADGLAPPGWPTREIDVDLETVELWGLKGVERTHRPSVVRGLAARGVLPAPGEAAAEEAARAFETLIEQLQEAAPQEHLMRRLGQVLARTTRLVNTLEQRVAAELSSGLSSIQRTLEEREREEHLRVKMLIARRARWD